MSNGVIAFFIAAGAGAWIYSKFMKYTGGNTRTAGIATGACAILIYFVSFFLLKLIPE